jgi:phosphatidylglycerophosphatase A
MREPRVLRPAASSVEERADEPGFRPDDPGLLADARLGQSHTFTDASAAPRRATWRFMGLHPLRLIALGFGSGLAPFAPGTFGTLFGWAAFVAIDHWLALTPLAWGLVLLASLAVGWWACTATARAMNVSDPGAVVWDEIIAIWLILWLVMPAGFIGQAIAFGLFRFFDAAKPGPVGWADAAFKGRPGQPPGWREGFGILFDDLVAAFCTLLVIALWRRLWP